MEGTISFVKLLELHIINQINKNFAEVPLNNDTLHKMHEVVVEQVTAVFKKSTSHKVSELSQKWLANEIFKHMTVKATDAEGKPEEKLVAELVIFNDYNMAELPYDDVKLLHGIFRRAAYGHLLEEELRRRSDGNEQA